LGRTHARQAHPLPPARTGLALHEAGVRAFVFTGGNVTIKDTGAILASALKHMSKIAHADNGIHDAHLVHLREQVMKLTHGVHHPVECPEVGA